MFLGCGGAGGQAPSCPLTEVGWGPADVWHTQSPELVDLACEAGIKYIVTEDRPSAQALDWRKGQIPSRFPEQARAWNERICANEQVHIVFVLNWNMVPLTQQSDGWAEQVWQEVARDYDPTCTIIEPIVEPEAHDAKAQRWFKRATEVWPGRVALPDGRNWPVRHDVLDRHPSSVADALTHIAWARPGVWLITDGPPLLDPLATLVRYSELTKLALANHVVLVFYTDRYPGPHEPVIAEIRKGIL